MYRLVLSGLGIIAFFAVVLGFVGVVPYSGIALLGSLFLLFFICYFSNLSFAKLFKAQTNNESSAITALILFCILAPATDFNQVLIVAGIAILAMASKYFLAVKRKHIFNPAAIAAVIAGLAGSVQVMWWIGSVYLLPIVLVIGLLIVRKIRRFSLFFAFTITVLVIMIISGLADDTAITETLSLVLLSWPLIFFGTIMLTEPLTTPPTNKLQIIYGIIVGAIFASQWRMTMGSMIIYPTPELSLIIGNLFAYIVSSKQRLQLTLVRQNKLSEQIYEFVLSHTEQFRFKAGQYLEWTLPHDKSDSRGVRRYFTIASSPTEKEIRLGIRYFPESSTFKKALMTLTPGSMLTAGSLSGDFTLPTNESIPLAFIAGGIGVTPFRSQIKYLVDTNSKRDIVLLYGANTESDFVYDDVFKNAEQSIGLKVVKVITDPAKAPVGWTGETGFITEVMIQKVTPDYKNRMWYLSGPNMMVENYKKILRTAGVPRKQIMTDYFPGF